MSDAWIRATVAIPFGLVVGSFLTVVVDRVPKKESIVSPRSRCPHCGADIRSRDNVPIVSYVTLGGRCRSCHSRISPRYPLLEGATAVAFVGVAIVYPSVYLIVLLSAFTALMLAVAAIDLELKVIPNAITYPAVPAFAVAIMLGWAIGRELDPLRSLMGALAYGGVFLLIALIAPRGLGMGDVKLTALIGLVMGSLGLRYVGVAAGSAILLGGLGGIAALLAGRGRKSAIPFGPFLAAGALVATFWGERLADWYLRSLS
jgi:leader peptidase (prepilin peptidase)/N-methyltransferase